MLYVIDTDLNEYEWHVGDKFLPGVSAWEVKGIYADSQEADAIINLFTHHSVCTVPFSTGTRSQSWYGDTARTIFTALGNTNSAVLREAAARDP